MLEAATKKIQFHNASPETVDFLEEVLNGLSQSQATISPKFFYDETGSKLFDQICHLPEYYPTRTEASILNTHAQQISDIIGKGCQLIEPGSGSSQKVRYLLDSLKPDTYIPMDISGDYIIQVSEYLTKEFPWLNIHAACIDFTKPLDLSFCPSNEHKVAFFPGSSIGNFEPQQAQVFLSHIADTVGRDGGILIGVDLKKDASILNAAYNDSQGITAQFNKNLLSRINNELGADFNVEQFTHRAFYNNQLGRIEMHIVSLCKQTVTIDSTKFTFEIDDSIHTENSYKYSIEEFQELAKNSGFEAIEVWSDSKNLFSVHYLKVKI